MGNIKKFLKSEFGSFYSCEDGQSMVEYGLILALIFLAALAMVVLTGGNIVKLYKEQIAPVLFPALNK